MMEFLEMGGYAFYVWGSFLVALLLMVVEPIMVAVKHRTLMKRLSRMIRMNAEESQ